MLSKHIFLTVEGIEGVGKTTAMEYIQDYLTQHKQAFIATREPGGTKIAEELRKILLTAYPEESLVPQTELLLMFAARAQHIHHVILPALQANKWVISDRFVDASYAYQGGGRQVSLKEITLLDDWIVQSLKPACTILLDAPVEIGLARTKNRGTHDRIEQEKVDFFERVRAIYLDRAKQFPERFFVIDATQSISEVHQRIKIKLDTLMKEKTT